MATDPTRQAPRATDPADPADPAAPPGAPGTAPPAPGPAQVAPAGIDPTVPNVARIYDYLLGGTDNYPADRAKAEQIMEAFPITRDVATANRMFIRYAVTTLADSGITQFLDIGSGLPTRGNVHEIARDMDPAARTVYVDADPVVVTHAAALLARDPDPAGLAAVQADARDTGDILAAAAEVLDLAQPVAVLMTCVLHFIPGDLSGVTAAYRDALAPGSALVLTHGTGTPTARAAAERLYANTSRAGFGRSPEEIEALLAGWVVDPPGLARVEHYTLSPAGVDDGDGPPEGWLAAAIGRKPR